MRRCCSISCTTTRINVAFFFHVDLETRMLAHPSPFDFQATEERRPPRGGALLPQAHVSGEVFSRPSKVSRRSHLFMENAASKSGKPENFYKHSRHIIHLSAEEVFSRPSKVGRRSHLFRENAASKSGKPENFYIPSRHMCFVRRRRSIQWPPQSNPLFFLSPLSIGRGEHT